MFVCIICLFSLTGCNQTSLESVENFYYVVAIGLDKAPKHNLLLTVQIATSSSNESSDSSQSTSANIYTVECNSIDSGISVFNNYLSKQLNFSHCSAVILSEEFSKSDITTYITTLACNTEIRPTSNIIISNTTSQEAIEAISNSSENFSAKLYEFIINSVDYTGYSFDATISDFFYKLYAPNSSPIATYVEISDKVLQTTGIAIFKNGKFINSLSVLDAICYSMITNNLKTCIINMPDPTDSSKNIDIIVSSSQKPDLKVNIINNYPYIEITNHLEYSIQDSNSSLNLENHESVKILKNAINNHINALIKSFLYKISHEYQTDICDFKNFLSNNYLTYDELEKVHWEEIYKDSYFEIKTESSITNSGLFSETNLKG